MRWRNGYIQRGANNGTDVQTQPNHREIWFELDRPTARRPRLLMLPQLAFRHAEPNPGKRIF